MVTRDQIWEQLGKRPFQAFRITMTDGATMDILRKNQAIVTPREFIIGDDAEDRFRWISLKHIDRIDLLGLHHSA